MLWPFHAHALLVELAVLSSLAQMSGGEGGGDKGGGGEGEGGGGAPGGWQTGSLQTAWYKGDVPSSVVGEVERCRR